MPGQRGQAIELGIGDYVDFGDDASLDLTGEMTMAAWIKGTTCSGGWCTIVSKYGNDYNRPAYEYGILNGNQIWWRGGSTNGYSSTTALSPDTWHHIAASRASGGNADIYIDGTYLDTITANVISSGGDFHIGVDNATGSYELAFFNGLIDEVLIYGRALTSQEIQQIYTAQK